MQQFRLFAFLLLTAAAALPLVAANAAVDYLALGDSVAFGYDPLVQVPLESNYTGYPQIVARTAPRYDGLASLACPGETSGSFLSSTAPDNHCRDFKGAFGLHTNYTGTQMEAAVSILQNERRIKLVTLSIGGNDLLLLQLGCQNQPACIAAGLPQVVWNFKLNLVRILTRVRLEGRYFGQIVLLTYYSPDYRDPLQTGGIAALNLAATQLAPLFGVRIADGFGAFAIASAPTAGDTCAAGLLIRVSPAACDVHPSPLGQSLLAATVARTLSGH